MKKIFVLLILLVRLNVSDAQSAEAQQLLLNVEKLAQLKKILQQLYDGYNILEHGYNAVKDISKGSFDLHKAFLDALQEVSPAVRKYQRVVDIINLQLHLVQEYKAAFRQFVGSGQFSAGELDYLSKTYARLFATSLQSIEGLALILTDGALRMRYDERLQQIDRIYTDVLDQYSFLQSFNNETAVLSVQREHAQQEIDFMRRMHGLP